MLDRIWAWIERKTEAAFDRGAENWARKVGILDDPPVPPAAVADRPPEGEGRGRGGKQR